MNIRTTLIASSLVAASLVSGAAQAALQGRDLDGNLATFEAYYDTDLNITWLANANMNGGMTWSAANAWAADLSIVDTVNNITYDDWRLPTMLQPDASCDSQWLGTSYGYNCTGNEMGHLFYNELGGTAKQSILTSADPDLAKFTNLQASNFWSAKESEYNYQMAWAFYMGHGGQYTYYKSDVYSALAVSPGDVGAVPEAETWAMLLAGVALVGAAVRRRRG